MKLFIKNATLFLIPILLFEVVVRLFLNPPTWYGVVDKNWHQDSQKVYLLGSSRTACAFVPQTIGNELVKATGKPIDVYNLGRGASSLMMHLFGLKQLLKSHPDALNGSLVVIEAVEGLPHYRTWSDSWLEGPSSLLPALIPFEKLPLFWKSSTELSLKLQNTFEYFVRLALWIPKIKEEFEDQGQKTIQASLMSVRQRIYPNRPVMGYQEIREVGGIRTDEVGIRHMREVIAKTIPQVKKRMEKETPYSNWRTTVLFELVELIKANGGRVAFADIPLPTVLGSEFHTPMREKDRELFRVQAKEWNYPILKASTFHYSELDFPDLSHLRANRAEEYSVLMAKEIRQAMN